MSLDQMSIWLNQHQLLVVSVLIPTISAIVAFFSSLYSTRRALKTEKLKLDFQGALKVAEFRQNWIDALRNAMAEFQSYGVTPGIDATRQREFYSLGTKVELLMNPNDPDYEKLSQCLYGFLEAGDGDKMDKYIMNPEFIEVCQSILKREWDRLKGDLQ